MTKSIEDYLEVIGDLEKINHNPRVKDIAAKLGISKPSVHTALHILEDKGMIHHEHYGAITLTEQGIVKYKEIRDKHDTLTLFLKNILGLTAEIAEKDACEMEHILSPETFSRIKELVQKHAEVKI